MEENEKFPWKKTLLIIAMFVVLWCCLAGTIIAIGISISQNGFDSLETGEFISTTNIDPEKESSIVSTDIPLTGNQKKNEYSFFDDFSSNALGWDLHNNNSGLIQIENETLSVHVKEQGISDSIFFPIDFNPQEISFDLWGQPASQDGSFRFLCNYLDSENFYYLELDLSSNAYSIAEVFDNVEIPLTTRTPNGYNFLRAPDLRSPRYVNHINIHCYPSEITLFINNRQIDQVDVVEPFETSGSGAFYAYTNDSFVTNGIKIFIDNVEIIKPRP